MDLSNPNQIFKLHKYFGHASAKNLKRIINASSYLEKVNQGDIDKVVEKCTICRLNSRKVNKKRAGLPKATCFNEVVSIDLKVHSDNTYILWSVNEAKRLMRGMVIYDKNPDTIIQALEEYG